MYAPVYIRAYRRGSRCCCCRQSSMPAQSPGTPGRGRPRGASSSTSAPPSAASFGSAANEDDAAAAEERPAPAAAAAAVADEAAVHWPMCALMCVHTRGSKGDSKLDALIAAMVAATEPGDLDMPGSVSTAPSGTICVTAFVELAEPSCCSHAGFAGADAPPPAALASPVACDGD